MNEVCTTIYEPRIERINVSGTSSSDTTQTRSKIVLIDDPYHDWDGDFVEFRLTYEGKLLGAGNGNKQVAHKHDLRKALHPQLRRLWDVNPSLKNMLHVPAGPVTVNRTDWTKRRDALPDTYTTGKYRFVPLVCEELGLLCSVDILFLRPEPKGLIIKSGDIDNRLKTLFDALRVPKNLSELPDNQPAPNEDPLYCLLEDDSLISRVAVETDLLLQPTRPEYESEPNDARLIITVKIKPAEGGSYASMPFL